MTIQKIASQIRATNLERSIASYTEALGFTLAFRFKDVYAAIDHGEHRLHLKLVDDRSTCRVRPQGRVLLSPRLMPWTNHGDMT